MKNKYILPLAATTTLFLAGCFSDEGNYDYAKIIEVTAPGIESSYNLVSLQDTLRVDPGLTPGDAFEYLWILGHTSPPRLDTIGTESVLDYPVKLKSGLYELVLRATNLASGQPTYHKTSLSVVTPFSVGFYVLKDMGDHTDLDLHIPDGDEPLSNLLEKSDKGVMNGKPTSLGVTFDYSYNNPVTNTNDREITLNICAGEEARIIRVDDMTTIYTNQEFFIGDVSTATPYYITHLGTGMVYVTSEGIFFNDLLMQGGGKFGIKRPVMSEDLGYVPNPRSLIVAPELYFYDDLNQRFLGIEGSVGLILPNYHGIPHELLYYGQNYAYQIARQGYAIFQDRDVPGKRYLYQTAMMYQMAFISDMAEINPSSKLNEATYFATNELDAFAIYFLHDNLLYMYDMLYGMEMPLSPQGLPAGEEITYVSNRYYQNPADAGANFNYLAIATHQAGRYKIYLYNLLGGMPYGDPVRVLEGEGKVAKMQYFTNKFVTDPVATGVNIDYIPLSI